MKTTIISLILMLLCWNSVPAQPLPTDSLYLGQTPPGNIPQIFPLAVTSGSFAAERIAITNDNKEIYYSGIQAYYPTTGDTIKYYKYSGGNWTGPFNLYPGFLAPALSVSGDTMYFQDNNSLYETYFSVRNGNSWSNPQRILASLLSAHYLQVTNNGHYYISSIPDPGIGASDWCSLDLTASDTTAISLGLPLNTTSDNLDFFVSRDETFMILSRNGMKISYHKDDGSWTNPKSLGEQINFGLGNWGPYVTSDNKYLFYTTGTLANYSDTYVYWVRIDSLIDSMRYTNFVPYLKNTIPQQNATKGEMFTFTVPDSTFIDDDGNNTLTYSAKLSNGSSLPGWLTFDSITATLSGIPDMTQILALWIRATDNAGASVIAPLRINIHDYTSIDQLTDQPESVKIYPNPSTDIINVRIDEVLNEKSIIEVSNLSGEVILMKSFRNKISIELADKPRGIYLLKIYTPDRIFISKISLI
jgi:hypothetical protein